MTILVKEKNFFSLAAMGQKTKNLWRNYKSNFYVVSEVVDNSGV